MDDAEGPLSIGASFGTVIVLAADPFIEFNTTIALVLAPLPAPELAPRAVTREPLGLLKIQTGIILTLIVR
ncbi:hypothetical protein UY3_02751 [Chelonia mydas]|uniref:Uncharacterized protein n=1 Tax=Chelonia mydas TaxID=8469 RepID=M7BPZ3_CHEMY|nr:hypothetical protein UY3_02751 [Chelonia mydas]